MYSIDSGSAGREIHHVFKSSKRCYATFKLFFGHAILAQSLIDGGTAIRVFNELLFFLNSPTVLAFNFKADELEHFVFLLSKKIPPKMDYFCGCRPTSVKK